MVYIRASQTFWFCDPILEKKFPCERLIGSLHIYDVKTINIQLQISSGIFVSSKIIEMHTIYQRTVAVAYSNKRIS